MNTKEAIEFIKFHRILHYDVTQEDGIDKVISLLQQGEKYEAIWKKFKKKYGNYWGAFDVREPNSNITYIADLIDDFEQKYFPKEE